MFKLGIIGDRGRFGCAVVRQAELAGTTIVLRVNTSGSLEIDAPDVVIDVSSARALGETVAYCQTHDARLLVGTSGLSGGDQAELVNLGAEVAVCRVDNFSLVHHLQQEILKIVAAFCVRDAVTCRAHVVERHPVFKKDKPSGTALSLADCWANLTGNRPEIESLREGAEVADHRVELDFGGERLTILHGVDDRTGPARTAVRVAQLLAEKPPGYYDGKQMMAELLAFSTPSTALAEPQRHGALERGDGAIAPSEVHVE